METHVFRNYCHICASYHCYSKRPLEGLLPHIFACLCMYAPASASTTSIILLHSTAVYSCYLLLASSVSSVTSSVFKGSAAHEMPSLLVLRRSAGVTWLYSFQSSCAAKKKKKCTYLSGGSKYVEVVECIDGA